jgi:hypothetical protein
MTGTMRILGHPHHCVVALLLLGAGMLRCMSP